MAKKNSLLQPVVISLFFLLKFLPLYAQEYSANAARTIFSDDAFPVEFKQLEAEVGWTLEKRHWTFPTLVKYSPVENLELGLSFDGIMVHDGAKVNETKVGNLGAQFKWLNYKSENLFGALVGSFSFSEKFLSAWLFYYTASFDMKRLLININAGGSFSEGEDSFSKSFLYAVSLIPKFKGNFGLYLEFHGELPKEEGVNLLNFGVNYSLNDRTVIDAGYRFSVSNPSEVWAFTMGTTIALAKF